MDKSRMQQGDWMVTRHRDRVLTGRHVAVARVGALSWEVIPGDLTEALDYVRNKAPDAALWHIEDGRNLGELRAVGEIRPRR